MFAYLDRNETHVFPDLLRKERRRP
jgi:hypothetical protein